MQTVDLALNSGYITVGTGQDGDYSFGARGGKMIRFTGTTLKLFSFSDGTHPFRVCIDGGTYTTIDGAGTAATFIDATTGLSLDPGDHTAILAGYPITSSGTLRVQINDGESVGIDPDHAASWNPQYLDDDNALWHVENGQHSQSSYFAQPHTVTGCYAYRKFRCDTTYLRFAMGDILRSDNPASSNGAVGTGKLLRNGVLVASWNESADSSKFDTGHNIFTVATGLDPGEADYELVFDTTSASATATWQLCNIVTENRPVTHSYGAVKEKWAFGGDSNTEMQITDPQYGWPKIICETLGLQWNWWGRTGETIGTGWDGNWSGLESWSANWDEAIDPAPTRFFLSMGTNNANLAVNGQSGNFSTDHIKTGVKTWLTGIFTRYPDVTFVHPVTMWQWETFTVNDSFKDYATQTIDAIIEGTNEWIGDVANADFADRVVLIRGDQIPTVSGDFVDGVHGGPTAHAKWAAGIIQQLGLALPSTAPTISLDSSLRLSLDATVSSATTYTLDNDNTIVTELTADDFPYDLGWASSPLSPHRARLKGVNLTGDGPYSAYLRLGGGNSGGGGGLTVTPNVSLLVLP